MPDVIDHINEMSTDDIRLVKVTRFEPTDPDTVTCGVAKLFFEAMCDMAVFEHGSMTAVYDHAAIQNDELYLNDYEGYVANDGEHVYTIRTIAIDGCANVAYCVFNEAADVWAYYRVD